jgi:queuosine precursor transporter
MTALDHHASPETASSSDWSIYALAGLYVGAAAAANLLIAQFGPPAVPVVSFLLVGFIITTRDRLHDAWQGRRLSVRLGLLIAAGSLVSYLVNADAASIAIASAVAFAVSESVNALVYQPMLARGVPWLTRVNAGNVPNALLDSLIFVTLAFGFAPGIIAGQVMAKVLGGALWSMVLAHRRASRRPGRQLQAPPTR